MLFKITLLTAYIFAVIYPLCFLIHAKDPIKNNFHKFHLGLPNVIGGVILVVVLLSDIPFYLKAWLIAWKVSFFVISRSVWKKQTPNAVLVALPSLFGFIGFAQMQTYYLHTTLLGNLISILAGFVLCSALYAMNLGHFYLNVHGLPIKHLRNATLVFWFFTAVRALWDVIYIFVAHVNYREEIIPLYKFTLTLDGFLILVAIFFGTLFPLVSLYFAHETIKLKNTQASTGILYVILCAVLLGDLAYKYYLIKYGIIL